MIATVSFYCVCFFLFVFLFSDGFSQTDQYNKDGIVHYVFQAVTGSNFSNNCARQFLKITCLF